MQPALCWALISLAAIVGLAGGFGLVRLLDRRKLASANARREEALSLQERISRETRAA